MQKITTCLLFQGEAEEAAQFYTTLLPNSRIVDVMRAGDAGPGPKGSAIMVRFQLGGVDLLALNGPPSSFTEAMSLSVDCVDQAEVDDLWERLTEGGEESMCGWLKDRYGVSWQIVPRELPKLLQHPDPAAAARAMNAMMQMRKIDIAKVRAAATERAGTAAAR